jgi:glycosyltransferase involved in cell wall biosynthesis
VPGVVDAVADGVNGLLVAPDDPEATATALGGLAADPRLAARLGSAGRERAAELAWPTVVNRYEAWLEHVIALPRRRERGVSPGWLVDLARGPRTAPAR